MSKSNFPKMVQGTARGSLILIMGQLITGVISTITIIWLARVLGPTSYGDYTLALVPVSIAMLFYDLGMHQSLTRFAAMYRFEKRGELKLMVWTGLIFSLTSSLIISCILYIFSGLIASSLLFRPELEPLVKITAFAVLGNGGLQTTIGAIFIGYELMGLKSLQLVLFSVFRGIIGVSLIVLGFGVVGAVTSYTIALILTGMIGFILFLKFIKFEGGSPGYFSVKSLKILIKFGLPISLSAIVGGTLTQLYSYFLALFVTTDLIGNYGASLNFGVVITFFTVPIQSSLLPLFSKFKRDDPRLQTVFRLAVKYTAMITLPLAVLIIALSQPISHLVYGASYTYVPLFLSLYLLSYVFEGLGGITLSNMILGLGETKVVFYTSLIILIVGAPLAQILISRYQVVGLLITMIVAPRFGWLYQTLWTKKHLNITIGVKGIYRVYLSTLTAFALTYALIYFTNLGNLGTILLGSLIFGAIYVLCLFYTGAVKKQDLEQIGETTESLGPASSIIRKVLPILLKFAKE